MGATPTGERQAEVSDLRLCLVRMYANGRELNKRIELPVGENGKPYLPHSTYERWCRELGVERGDTIIIL